MKEGRKESDEERKESDERRKEGDTFERDPIDHQRLLLHDLDSTLGGLTVLKAGLFYNGWNASG